MIAFREWLGSNPNVTKVESDSRGEGFAYVREEGPPKRIKEDDMAAFEGAYQELNTPDAQGRLRHGSDIAGVSGSSPLRAYNAPDHVTIDGQPMTRTRHGYDELLQNENNRPVFEKLGVRPEDFSYNEQYGYVMEPAKWKVLEREIGLANDKDGFLDKFMDGGGGVMLAAGGFLGPVAAAGGMGAGGLAGAEAAGAAAASAGGAMDMGVGLSGAANSPVWGFTGGQGLSAFGTPGGLINSISNIPGQIGNMVKKNPIGTLNLLTNLAGGQQQPLQSAVDQVVPMVQGDLSKIQLRSGGLINGGR
jgi:hypothetical protein